MPPRARLEVEQPVLPAQSTSTLPAIGEGEVPHLLINVRKGLEQLLERGGIDARASRQREVNPKVRPCVLYPEKGQLTGRRVALFRSGPARRAGSPR